MYYPCDFLIYVYYFGRPATPLDSAEYGNEAKFLVFHGKLMELFEVCRICGGPTCGNWTGSCGSLIEVTQKCFHCGYVYTWNSQPYLRKMPAGNLILSAAILFSGSLPAQALRLFSILRMQCLTRNTYHRHQRNYIIPTIINTWQIEQSKLFSELKDMGGGLKLAGDGRNDSPGHSAKYGGYTVIEQRINKVLEMQLVQVI